MKKILFAITISGSYLISASEDHEKALKARVAVELCRQAGHQDLKFFACLVLLNEVAKESNQGVDNATLADVYTSEEAIVSGTFNDVETKFRKDARECCSVMRGFESNQRDSLNMVKCLQSKGYPQESIAKYVSIAAEEDGRKRILNRASFDPSTPKLIEALKKDSFINGEFGQ